MAKDGTKCGGAGAGAGRKPKALAEKVAEMVFSIFDIKIDLSGHVETVVLLSHKKIDTIIDVKLNNLHKLVSIKFDTGFFL